jgi:hypothetical protein
VHDGGGLHAITPVLVDEGTTACPRGLRRNHTMNRRAVRLAVGLWCLAIVYGVATMTDHWSDIEASQAGPAISSMEEASSPGEPLEEAVAFAKDFLLQGFPYTTIRAFLLGASIASHHGREKPVR